MKIHISFAHGRFLQSQQKCKESALTVGEFDISDSLNINNIDMDFLQENKNIFSCRRGIGYWLWKPYFIKKYLEKINNNDILVYTDAGINFIKPIWNIHEKYSKQEDNGFMSTGECGINSQFTKRDAFILMDLDDQIYANAGHKTASCIVIKKNNNSLFFVNEWLKYAQNINIISDLPNTQGKENYLNYIDHRHDQSIFSLLCKKHNITHCEEGLCQFHRPNDYYILHHRNPN